MQASNQAIRRRLKIAAGQVDGILRMVDEDRYCIDISNQIMAVINALKGINRDILHAHLEHCVTTSLEAKDPQEIEAKMEEVIAVIDKLAR